MAQGRKRLRRVRFPGIIAAADRFGCHRMHLYMVLAGTRTSHSLLEKWARLNARFEWNGMAWVTKRSLAS